MGVAKLTLFIPYIVNDLVNDSPTVGIVVTISPNLSLYNIVVLPAASSPSQKVTTCRKAYNKLLTTHQYANIFATFVPG